MSQDNNTNNEKSITFSFVELTMAVILGILMTEVTTNYADGLSKLNMFFSIFSILLFLEMYIVLHKFHKVWRVPYIPLYLVFDCVIGFFYILMLLLMLKFEETVTMSNNPFLFGIVLFICLVIRQVEIVYKLKYRTPQETNAEVLSDSKYLLPLIAAMAGVLLCVAMYKTTRGEFYLDLQSWAGVSLLVFTVYFFCMHIFKISLRS